MLTNPDKIFWPKEKYTKHDLMDYYQFAAPYILPFLKNRPIVLRRFPDGIEGPNFVQKNAKAMHLADWIQTVKVEHTEKDIFYFLIQDEASLEYAVNLGTIEFHPFHSQVGQIDFPDYFILDMDPEDLAFDTVIRSALEIHELFDEWKMPHYCKTSGGRGLHIYIPLHAQYDVDQVSNFGQLLGQILHEHLPKITSLERSPSKRQKKIYLDVLQNRAKQTVVAPYSVRGRPKATVSTPLTWDEVKKGMKPQDFTIKTIPPRLQEIGEIFSPIFKKKFDMKKWLAKMQKAKV